MYLFYLKITTPQGLLYGGNIKSLTSYNDSGKFDILKDHTNFIATIKNQLEILTDTDEKKVFPVDKGVIRVVNNIVDVYLGIGE